MAEITQHMSLEAIDGNSGRAYKGYKEDGTPIFVKYEVPPIVASLAKEHITPPVLSMSRELGVGNRMEQEWLDGGLLSAEDMASKQVMQILHRLHFSGLLRHQAIQMKYQINTPRDLLKNWEKTATVRLLRNTYLRQVCEELKRHFPAFSEDKATVVHGDLHHRNWVRTKAGYIYLTDWETVHLADRMQDVAYILTHYIPRNSWKEWLTNYGYRDTPVVLEKLYWYGQLAYLNQITKDMETNNLEAANREIYALRQFKEEFYQYPL